MAVDRQLQVIENRYIDRNKLRLHLEQTFGENNFAIRLQLNRWVLNVPRKLAEDEIDGCCPDNDTAKNHKPSADNDEPRVPLRFGHGRPMAISGPFSHTLGSAAIEKVESA